MDGLCRGLSSTVRKCVSRENGVEYAVKIIDKSQDDAITESITAEVQVLHYLPKHSNISEHGLCTWIGGMTLTHVCPCSYLQSIYKTSLSLLRLFS